MLRRAALILPDIFSDYSWVAGVVRLVIVYPALDCSEIVSIADEINRQKNLTKLPRIDPHEN